VLATPRSQCALTAVKSLESRSVMRSVCQLPPLPHVIIAAIVNIRVHFADDSTEDYPANHVEIAGDGSLLLAHKSQRESPVVAANGQRQIELTSKLIRIIRRDLWAEVELIDADEPEILEFGRREPALAVN
jgi:hypothetical protein